MFKMETESSFMFSVSHIIYHFFRDIIISVISVFGSLLSWKNIETNEKTIIHAVENAIQKEIFYNYAIDDDKKWKGMKKEEFQNFSKFLSILEFTQKYFLIPKQIRPLLLMNCHKLLTEKRHDFFNKKNNMDGMYFLSQKLLSILKIYEKRFQKDNINLISRIISYNIINCRCRVFDYIIFELLIDFHNNYIRIIENELKKSLKRSIKYS